MFENCRRHLEIQGGCCPQAILLDISLTSRDIETVETSIPGL